MSGAEDRVSVVGAAQAKRMLADQAYRVDVLGNHHCGPLFEAWQQEWLARIAGRWTACSCPVRHRGDCSSQPQAEVQGALFEALS